MAERNGTLQTRMSNPNPTPKVRGLLRKTEEFWRDHHGWLLESGYTLRSRYQPDWKPSWVGTKKDWHQCEDGIWSTHFKIVDAQRTKDGAIVMLKRFKKSIHPYEVEIGQYFSSEALASDPQNHCVPIFEVLQVPDDDDEVILVMPQLREFDDPRFDTIGEIVDFFSQIFEGLQYMHKHHVAHRDCGSLNIMMDASNMYIDRYHPFRQYVKHDLSGRARHYTRTQRPVKYYLTDFGLSRKYDPQDGVPLEPPILGGDKSVPEYQDSDEPRNPFPADVYYLGNVIREKFTVGYEFESKAIGLDFIKPLVADMVQDDPSKRPTMDEVVERFTTIRKGLSSWTLRSRVVKQSDSSLTGVFRFFGHWQRRIVFVVKRVPAVPSPP
ncbi:hypothetical protein HGRIS_006688 [Hohenbuehelia grisea]|uniref:Protein kinase domain-containing protein n=1 Tax=Hohenbuehelia grisea TaxID=104357 RepID=A0ABR3J9R9_9AGAR